MRGQVAQSIEHYVGWMRAQTFGAKAIGYAARMHSRIARGFDIHVGVSYHHGLVRRGLQLAQQNLRALRVGLLGFEAVAAVDVAEITGEVQSLDNRAAEMHGLVG